MVKLVFWLLLAINIVVFATTLDTSDTAKTPTQISTPAPVKQEKILILSSSPYPLPGSAPKQKDEQPATTCIEIGNFSPRDADIFEEKMALPPDNVNRITTSTASSYMVYIPPSENMKTANRKIAELKEKGIANHFLIPEGKFRHAISLGIFKTEDSARKLITELEKRGIHDVAVAGRGKMTQHIVFRINSLDSRQLDHINNLLAQYPQTDRKDCRQPDEISR